MAAGSDETGTPHSVRAVSIPTPLKKTTVDLFLSQMSRHIRAAMVSRPPLRSTPAQPLTSFDAHVTARPLPNRD